MSILEQAGLPLALNNLCEHPEDEEAIGHSRTYLCAASCALFVPINKSKSPNQIQKTISAKVWD